MNHIYHVATSGNDRSDGSLGTPFRTISKAAELAEAGDTVIVHEGTYREWVKPRNGGADEHRRIVYKAALGEKVVIKGSEKVTGWEKTEGTVWKVRVDNRMFGNYNPYAEKLGGDWYFDPDPKTVALHTGDVYLNGRSLYEAHSLEALKNPEKREWGFNAPWTNRPEPILHPEETIYQWYAVVSEEFTDIYVNFHEYDPNMELTEINVRQCCFYPELTGLNYITVRGFEMAQAACPFVPPTADQPGLIGPHWSKGWIIEDNIIHDAKCSGISLGKERSTGHNLHCRTHQKSGYQYQLECVFSALQKGWSKDTVGSHIVRNNKIYDCGQNAIVGHMGCAFSKIYGNEIYNIAVKHEYYGYEIGGIKLHAGLDVQICNNYIHNCTLGTWMDWETQGVRISGNLYNDNDRDFFIEVSHGPYLVDNNIFGSDYVEDIESDGGAYINNLCCGSIRRASVLDRSTPYHYPHSTAIAGMSFVFGGDDRIRNNIFIGGVPVYAENASTGTAVYQKFSASYEEYMEKICAYPPSVDNDKYFEVAPPVYINCNAYLNGADHFEREEIFYSDDRDPECRIITQDDGVYLEITLPEEMFRLRTEVQSTETLGFVRMVNASYDDPDGNPIVLDRDYFGTLRGEHAPAGPITDLKPGFNRVKIR